MSITKEEALDYLGKGTGIANAVSASLTKHPVGNLLIFVQGQSTNAVINTG